MGVRIDAYAADVRRLSEFLNCSLADLLRFYSRNGKDSVHRLSFTRTTNCDTFWTARGKPIQMLLEGAGKAEELTEETIRANDVLPCPAKEHFTKGSAYESARMFRAFSHCEGVDFIRELIGNHRRWWIGSALQSARHHLTASEYEELELLFRKILRGANCGYEIVPGDSRFDRAGLPFVPDDDADFAFGHWNHQDCNKASRLLSKLSSFSPMFTRPPGPIGIAPDDSEWHGWVQGNVESLLRIPKFGYDECALFSYIG